MMDVAGTGAARLRAAAAIARRAGLRHVYAGNLPGEVGDLEDTVCAGCGCRLIERYGYFVKSYAITGNGCCPACRRAVPGRWPAAPIRQRTTRPFLRAVPV